ncbi:MAG: helix-turn-helix domain-containing protein, partial [Lachnospiraceae bacterium]|nr:helix-turn-helix domain-containing protein [Lachnospiraceae bacterium]
EELNRLTGLPLKLEAIDAADLPETVEKIRQITTAWREKNSRSVFLAELLRGELTDADIASRAAGFHIAQAMPRNLFLVETDGESSDLAYRILRQMFTASNDLIVRLGGKMIALIRQAASDGRGMGAMETARMVVDMLNAEAMVRARVAFAEPSDSLEALPAAYRDALTALSIGRIFYSYETVIDFGRLGIGRLINELPVDVCRRFLKEVYGDHVPDDFDEETRVTIDTFLGNNLNISETARQLYLHRNTLVYRLEKLHLQTGLDIRLFEDAMTFKIASMVNGYLKSRESGNI